MGPSPTLARLLEQIDALQAEDDLGDDAQELIDNEYVEIAVRRLTAVQCTRLRRLDARKVTEAECGRSTRSWLIEEQQVAPVEASRRLRVARHLPAYPVVAAAFSKGEISSEHVRGILTTVAKLPAEVRDTAEGELVEAARWADPVALGRLCREVRSRLLADEDAEAQSERKFASRWATASTTFDGMVNLQAMLDPEAGATLLAALAALSGKAGVEDDRTLGQRRADALTELAQHSLDRGELPEHGGDRPQVTVTLDYQTLKAQIDAARQAATAAAAAAGQPLIGGSVPISPQTARRLACDAEIIPAVLNGQSEVLDLGRSQRTWTKAQRRAARLRDQGCVFPKCQAGLDRCQLHHIQHWAHHRGPTNHDNSAHLCHYHHRLIHHTTWQIRRNTDGTIEAWRHDDQLAA